MSDYSKKYLVWWIISLVHLFVFIVFNIDKYPYFWVCIFLAEAILFYICVYYWEDESLGTRIGLMIVSPLAGPLLFSLAMIMSVVLVPFIWSDDRRE